MTPEPEDLLARYLDNRQRHAEFRDCLAELGQQAEHTHPPVASHLAQCRRHGPGGDCDCTRYAPAPGARGPVPEPVPGVPEPRAEMLMELHRVYAADGDPEVRAELAAAYDEFALTLARRFHTRRESAEDLGQVARIGLLHAIDRFDPGRERPFPVFARATIVGELKRHVRDRTWVLRVPRSLQEHYLEVVRTADDLAQELGRSPGIPEIAERTGLSEDHVLEAMELGAVQRPASLDAPLPDGKSLEPGTDDPGLAAAEGRAYMMDVLARLPQKEREILRLRFVDGLTQTQIGARLGVSQMYVSRTLSRTLGRLRARGRAS